MNQEAQFGGSRKLNLLGWILVPILILGTLYLMTLRGGKTENPENVPSNGGGSRNEENYLAQVRSTLARQTDLATCRTVIQQLNAHLNKAEEHRAAALASADAERLRSTLGLQPDDLAEINATSYTPLDAHHLEACFLLRDAARALEVSSMEAGGKTSEQTRLERAVNGFEWTVRQVRLSSPDQMGVFPGVAPPAAVLRRGQGTALERALVFLALLEQLGLDENEGTGVQGCLVFLPGEKGQKRLWACGVATGRQPDSLYLFDPHLGLPVPGPGGKGVATLAEARADATVLGQLKVDKLVYDVTQEQAKQATVGVVVPLSAVSSRMHLLQDRLLRERSWQQQSLPAQVRVRLAEDPAVAQGAIKKAVDSGTEVSAWQPGTLLLRRFLPREEGGNDTGIPFEIRRVRGFTTEEDTRVANLQLQRLYHLIAVPWEEFPVVFRDPEQFRFDLGLGQQLRGIFAAPFLSVFTTPDTPRDQILRGRYSKAVSELVRELEQSTAQRRRLLEAENLRQGVTEWVQQATAAYADVLRARGTGDESAANTRFQTYFRWKPGAPIEVLINGAIAGPRSADLLYQLALGRHEQAAHLQARLDLAARAGITLKSDATQARTAWIDAEGYWKEYVEGHAKRPGAAAARRLLGETQMRLGRADDAKRSWEDVAAPMTEMERLGTLWLAKQVDATPKK